MEGFWSYSGGISRREAAHSRSFTLLSLVELILHFNSSLPAWLCLALSCFALHCLALPYFGVLFLALASLCLLVLAIAGYCLLLTALA